MLPQVLAGPVQGGVLAPFRANVKRKVCINLTWPVQGSGGSWEEGKEEESVSRHGEGGQAGP